MKITGKVFNYTNANGMDINNGKFKPSGWINGLIDKTSPVILESQELVNQFKTIRFVAMKEFTNIMVMDFDGKGISKSSHIDLWTNLINLINQNHDLGIICLYPSPSIQNKNGDEDYFGFRMICQVENIKDFKQDYNNLASHLSNIFLTPLGFTEGFDLSCNQWNKLFYGTVSQEFSNKIGIDVVSFDNNKIIDLSKLNKVIVKSQGTTKKVKKSSDDNLFEFCLDFYKNNENTTPLDMKNAIMDEFTHHFNKGKSDHDSYWTFSFKAIGVIKSFYFDIFNSSNWTDYFFEVDSDDDDWFGGRSNDQGGFYKQLVNAINKGFNWNDCRPYKIYKKDNFSKVTNNLINIFDEVIDYNSKYIGDTPDLYNLINSDEKELAITAPTGSGKTNVIQKLLRASVYTNKLFILVLPYNLQIAQNISNLISLFKDEDEFNNYVSTSLTTTFGEGKLDDLTKIKPKNIIVTTPDKLENFRKSLILDRGNDIDLTIIFDEGHNLFTASDYRGNAIKSSLRVLRNYYYSSSIYKEVTKDNGSVIFDRNKFYLPNQKVRLISATIPKQFKVLFKNYKFIKFINSGSKSVRKIIFHNNYNISYADVIKDFVNKGHNVLFLNDGGIESENKPLETLLESEGITCLNFNAKLTVSDSKNFNAFENLKNSGKNNTKTDLSDWQVIITTSSGKEGVDYHDTKNRIIITTSHNYFDIVQISGRMRNFTDIETTTIVLYKDEEGKTVSNKDSRLDFTSTINNNYFDYDKLTKLAIEDVREDLQLDCSLAIQYYNTNKTNIKNLIPRLFVNNYFGDKKGDEIAEDSWGFMINLLKGYYKNREFGWIENEGYIPEDYSSSEPNYYYLMQSIYDNTNKINLELLKNELATEGFIITNSNQVKSNNIQKKLKKSEQQKEFEKEQLNKLSLITDMVSLEGNVDNIDIIFDNLANGNNNKELFNLTKEDFEKNLSDNGVVMTDYIESIYESIKFRNIKLEKADYKLIGDIINPTYECGGLDNKKKLIISQLSNKENNILLDEFKKSKGVTDYEISFENSNELREYLLNQKGFNKGLANDLLSNYDKLTKKNFSQFIQSKFIIKRKFTKRDKKNGGDVQYQVFVI